MGGLPQKPSTGGSSASKIKGLAEFHAGEEYYFAVLVNQFNLPYVEVSTSLEKWSERVLAIGRCTPQSILDLFFPACYFPR